MPNNLPKPNTPATPEHKVYIAVLGGLGSGIYALSERPSLPFPKYGGPAFPIAVYCRTLDDAHEVMRLRGVIENIQDEDIDAIKKVLLSSPVACGMFEEERGIRFFPALHSNLKYACIFLTWADAYRRTSTYQYARVARAKTFVDALVYLCEKPFGAADLYNPIHYERPQKPDERPQEQGDRPREQTSEPMKDISSMVASLSLNGESSQQPARSQQPATADVNLPSYRRPSSPVPVIVGTRVRYVRRRPVESTSAPLNVSPSTALVVVRARDIQGNILGAFHALPSATERVPSLGALADELLDSFGYLESSVVAFRDAYFAAGQATGSDARVEFVQTMAEHGMAQKEASTWFTILQGSIGENTGVNYRYRPSLQIE